MSHSRLKVWVLSDLHFEFGGLNLDFLECDVLVLAGDIHLGGGASDFIKGFLQSKQEAHVVYVLGNHEYYNYNLREVKKYWREYPLKKVHFLENEAIHIKGVRFVGATLWTSMNESNAAVMCCIKNAMSDYSLIGISPGRKLRPEDTVALFEESKAFIVEELNRETEAKTVVVTHHLPTYKSVAKEYEDSSLNPAFVSNLDKVIMKYQPDVWIHGHTHASFDYLMGKTRILCNPAGYRIKPVVPENHKFNPNLVIEV